MPATRAVTGNGAIFYIGSLASPLGYNALLEIKSINLPMLSVPDVDASHLLSPSATEESIAGLNKPGLLDVSGNFIGDSSQLSILPLAQGQTTFAWKAVGSVDKGTKTYTASGIGHVANYAVGPFEQNKAVEFKLQVQISGTITESVA